MSNVLIQSVNFVYKTFNNGMVSEPGTKPARPRAPHCNNHTSKRWPFRRYEVYIFDTVTKFFIPQIYSEHSSKPSYLPVPPQRAAAVLPPPPSLTRRGNTRFVNLQRKRSRDLSSNSCLVSTALINAMKNIFLVQSFFLFRTHI